jgi:hypothetical protein
VVDQLKNVSLDSDDKQALKDIIASGDAATTQKPIKEFISSLTEKR